MQSHEYLLLQLQYCLLLVQLSWLPWHPVQKISGVCQSHYAADDTDTTHSVNFIHLQYVCPLSNTSKLLSIYKHHKPNTFSPRDREYWENFILKNSKFQALNGSCSFDVKSCFLRSSPALQMKFVILIHLKLLHSFSSDQLVTWCTFKLVLKCIFPV